MRRKSVALLLAMLFFAPRRGWTKQAQADPFPRPATIRCDGQAYVPITADEEQQLPLQIVEKAACGEAVTVLTDPQGYTARVRTASGKAGYVARYQLVMDAAPLYTNSAAPDGNSGRPAAPPTESAASPVATAGQNAAGKPHVYVSDTASWNASGGFSNPSSVPKGALYGGYDPGMVDIYQDFISGCSVMSVTQEKSRADVAVLFDKGSSKQGWTGLQSLVNINKLTELTPSVERQ